MHRNSMMMAQNPNASIWAGKDANKNKCRGFDDSKQVDISAPNHIWPESDNVKDFMDELKDIQKRGTETDMSRKVYAYPEPIEDPW